MSDKPDISVDPIVAQLRLRHTLNSSAAYGMLALGSAIILAAAGIVATVICFITLTLFSSTWIGWWGWFFVFLLGILPLLIREERRSRGNFLIDRATDFGTGASSRGEFELQQFEVGVAAYTEMLLWGPRAVIKGVATLRGEEPLAQSKRFEHAAAVIRALLKSDSGISVKELGASCGNIPNIKTVLQWLDQHDYIGISADRKRLWLTTEARNRLRNIA